MHADVRLQEYRMDLPYDARAPEEKIVRSASIVVTKSQELGKPITQCEALVLAYVGLSEFPCTRDLEQLIVNALPRTEPGETMLGYRHLGIDAGTSAQFLASLGDRVHDLEPLVVRVVTHALSP